MKGPREAAIEHGVSEENADWYVRLLEERDDFLEWEDEGRLTDWKIDAVEIPEGARRVIDTDFGETAWEIAPGVLVYDSEPDCVVSIHLGDRPGRLVPT